MPSFEKGDGDRVEHGVEKNGNNGNNADTNGNGNDDNNRNNASQTILVVLATILDWTRCLCW